MTQMKKDEQELYMVAGSHLVKAGINPMTAAAIIRLGIAHRDMTAKLEETKDQADKMDVFGTGYRSHDEHYPSTFLPCRRGYGDGC